MDSKTYKTKQRSAIMSFFEDNPDKCFSAKDLIRNKSINLGEATVYRSLAKFVSEGKIRKFTSADSEGAFYQLSARGNECDSHFHLKCTQCGILIHMDCSLMSEIKEHISADHGFCIDNAKTTLYGICEKCSH